MPEPRRPADPLALQALALRYAAGELPPADADAFEDRLGSDPAAQDALSEAVRLSAAALGQAPPAPDRSFRAMIGDRLSRLGRLWPGWLARRAYRGHPLAWAVSGAAALAVVCAVAVPLVRVAPAPPPPTPTAAVPAAVPVPPPPREVGPGGGPAARPVTDPVAVGAGDPDPLHAMAEHWEQMSTCDHVERAHDDELRWRQRLKDLQDARPGRPPASLADGP